MRSRIVKADEAHASLRRVRHSSDVPRRERGPVPLRVQEQGAAYASGQRSRWETSVLEGQRARRWAVDFHASPEDYYRERLPKYRTATGDEAGSGAALFHGQTVRPAAEKLAEEAEAWAGLVDGLKAKPEKAQRMLSQTPLVFHLLGANFREVYAAPHVFDGMFPGKAKKGHHAHTNIDAGILKQIPSALADPRADSHGNCVQFPC